MMRLHQLAQSLGQHVGVDLRRRDVGVAQKHLQTAQVGAVRQQMRGERMAQHVRRDPGRVDPRLQSHLFQQKKERLAGQWPRWIAAGKQPAHPLVR